METEEILAAIQKAAETIATPNWAAWLSAVATVGTLVVAVIVAIMQYIIYKKQNEIAKKQTDISDKQNKIALFEKRYAVYREIVKITSLDEGLDSQEPLSIDTWICALEAVFGIILTREQDINTKVVVLSKRLLEADRIVNQSIFLFPHINEKDVDALLEDAFNFIASIPIEQKEINLESIQVKKFVSTCKAFKEKYFDKILSELDLTGGV